MKLTVFGASGGIGGRIVEQALEDGHEVTAVVRDSSSFERKHPALEVFRVAGLGDPQPLRPAIRACDAVISGVGPRGRKSGPVATTATRGILGALEAEGVHRFVAVSASPVGPVPPGDTFVNRRIMLPFISAMLQDLYADLTAMETDVERSASDWTIVRPPRLTNQKLTGTYRTVIGGNVPGGYSISRADVAHLMLDALNNRTMFNRAVGIAY